MYNHKNIPIFQLNVNLIYVCYLSMGSNLIQTSPNVMKKSASSRFAEAAKMKSPNGNTITSIDGTRTLSWEDFEQLFESGSDEIDAFIDWSKTQTHGGHRAGSGRKPSGRKPFVIRMKPAVHKRFKDRAKAKGISLAEYVEQLAE
jgi:predicted HicB family RNase H-like nuclease